MNRQGRVLIVDDEQSDPVVEQAVAALVKAGLLVDRAASTLEAREQLRATFYHLLMLDIWMKEEDSESHDEGMKLLEEWRHLIVQRTPSRGTNGYHECDDVYTMEHHRAPTEGFHQIQGIRLYRQDRQ